MIIGIDASNIRAGGGVTHLKEVLHHADPNKHGIREIIVWSNKKTLNSLSEKPWLKKINVPILNKSLIYRLFWSPFYQRKEAERCGCSVLFVPGGSDASGFSPMVTMSQNLLPFEWSELKRYGFSMMTLKGLFLRVSQGSSFRKAAGTIFLTEYARNAVFKAVKAEDIYNTIIPHGINPIFDCNPEDRYFRKDFTHKEPCRLLYVSGLLPYKHQDKVIEAVVELKKKGIHLRLDLVGPDGPLKKKVEYLINLHDKNRSYLDYKGKVDYSNLDELYRQADIGIFASTCETFGQILTESMNAGLPMVCSNKSAMPEILKSDGLYFDPEDVDSLVSILMKIMSDDSLRKKLAYSAYESSLRYTWENCSDSTLKFLTSCINK